MASSEAELKQTFRRSTIPRVTEENMTSLQRTPESKAASRKVNHVHKLERKHSSGDLQSRLKTRKLLGVGETDDGDVHRSKLSQILGHSEQLYVRLPRGLRAWQFLSSFLLTVSSLWALLFPRHWLASLLNAAAVDEGAVLPMRLYAVALLGFSVVLWGTCGCTDRDVIRCSLFAVSLMYLLQTLVTWLVVALGAVCSIYYLICSWQLVRLSQLSIQLPQFTFVFAVTAAALATDKKFTSQAVRALGPRLAGGAISLVYYWLVGDRIHKSSSQKVKDKHGGDLGDSSPSEEKDKFA